MNDCIERRVEALKCVSYVWDEWVLLLYCFFLFFIWAVFMKTIMDLIGWYSSSYSYSCSSSKVVR